MFNTNTFHNILNVLIALSASMIAIRGFAAAAVAALSILKIIINIMRDGITGLIKPHPPVDK